VGGSDKSWVSAGGGSGRSEASIVPNVMRRVRIRWIRHERARVIVDDLWRSWEGCRGSSVVGRWAMIVWRGWWRPMDVSAFGGGVSAAVVDEFGWSSWLMSLRACGCTRKCEPQSDVRTDLKT
jgi:hypothetical protein